MRTRSHTSALTATVTGERRKPIFDKWLYQLPLAPLPSNKAPPVAKNRQYNMQDLYDRPNDKLIPYWYCPTCTRMYNHSGLCEDCSAILKPGSDIPQEPCNYCGKHHPDFICPIQP